MPEEAVWTSALATADFLQKQRPGGSAFAIGEAGLTTALHEAGYTLTERSPDYVVLGETRSYSFERITRAIRLVADGARFIATNPDPTGANPAGPVPATGSVAALISRASGVEPYYVGKPNPLMMRSALNAIDAHSESTAMVGDRMDTDIVAGLEAGLETILVFTGVTSPGTVERFPYRPSRMADSIADLVDELGLAGAGSGRAGRVPVVEHERVAVRVREVGHVTHPAVERVGAERDAERLELGARGRDVLDVQRDRMRVRWNSMPNASDCMTAIVRVPVSNSAAGMLPQRAEHGRPSTVPSNSPARSKSRVGTRDGVNAGDPHRDSLPGAGSPPDERHHPLGEQLELADLVPERPEEHPLGARVREGAQALRADLRGPDRQRELAQRLDGPPQQRGEDVGEHPLGRARGPR